MLREVGHCPAPLIRFFSLPRIGRAAERLGPNCCLVAIHAAGVAHIFANDQAVVADAKRLGYGWRTERHIGVGELSVRVDETMLPGVRDSVDGRQLSIAA